MTRFRDSRITLALIVLAQLLCTALWFAGNGVLQALTLEYNLTASALGHLTTAIQLGFISGTLIYALLRIADRFAPSKVFLISAIAGAAMNVLIVASFNTLTSLLILRFMTGFFLAGIYPVGMKIASDYYEKGLGKAMGYLVGALVVGTALPHLLRAVIDIESWRFVIWSISILALAGGLIIGGLVGDGPYRKPGVDLRLRDVFRVFKPLNFRRAAFGYFGHMWELYAFWAFVPVFLTAYFDVHGGADNLPLYAFLAIGIGGLGCVLNGYLSDRIGVGRAAILALAISGLCCIGSPWVFALADTSVFIVFMLLWGLTVVADSPMFSTLVAWEAPAESRGTALTLVTCIGFATTIISIQLLNFMSAHVSSEYLFVVLVAGPMFGLMAMRNG